MDNGQRRKNTADEFMLTLTPSQEDDQKHAANETEESISQQQTITEDVWIPPVTVDITRHQEKGTMAIYTNDPITHAQVAIQKDSVFCNQSTEQHFRIQKLPGKATCDEQLLKDENKPKRVLDISDEKRLEENVVILYDEIKFILESEEYDKSLRMCLHESYPDYIKILERRRSDILREDHSIVVAGETSSGKSTLINKILEKRIFKPRNNESTSTICKIRNSEKIRITAELNTGERKMIHLTDECNLETENGRKLLRDTLSEMTDKTSSEYKEDFRWVDIGLPIPIFKDNTIIVDTPGIGGTGENSHKLMEYLPNAVSFIFVVNVASAGGMQNDRLPEILKSILFLQLDNEMPCFDPRDVIFITNKWDTIPKHDESSDEEEGEESRTWYKVLKNIKERWPSVREENIFKLNLNEVSSKKSPAGRNDSTMTFDHFKRILMKIIEKNRNTRISQHMRFLHEFLGTVAKGTNARLELGKRSEEGQRILSENHRKRIKRLKKNCVEGEKKLRGDFTKMIEDAAQDAYDYMSTIIGKNTILNPPGSTPIMDVRYLPGTFCAEIKQRVDVYVDGVVRSDKLLEKFQNLLDKASALEFEVSSELSKMDDEWTGHLKRENNEDNANKLLYSCLAMQLVFRILLIPHFGLPVYDLMSSMVFGWHLIKMQIVNGAYEKYRSSIRSTICNHLENIYGNIFDILVKKITQNILPQKITSLEKKIEELSDNRREILAKQTAYENLSSKIKNIEEKLLKIEPNI